MKKIRNNKELAAAISTLFLLNRNPAEIDLIIKRCNASIRHNSRVSFYNDLELAVTNDRPDLVEFICDRDINTTFALWRFGAQPQNQQPFYKLSIYQNIISLLALNNISTGR